MEIEYTSNEIWQVDVNGQVYEAALTELTDWIAEGSLLPQDKVRRGNLRWLEAGKIPVLHGFFNAKELGVEPPVLTFTNTEEVKPETNPQPVHSASFAQITNLSVAQQQNFQSSAIPATKNALHSSDTGDKKLKGCRQHPKAEPKFICGSCSSLYCLSCPTSYGGKVKICPACGQICQLIEELQAKHEQKKRKKLDLLSGFGFADFGKALAYPFKFNFSLISGAVLFMIFTLGQSAAALGAPFMVASIFCLMLANALTFGCLANTVGNLSQGKLYENFMPEFADFSLWDDVIHPFLLSIGVYIVSFGLLIAVAIGVFWYAARSFAEQPERIETPVTTAQPETPAVAENEDTKNLDFEQLQKQKQQDLEELNRMLREQKNQQWTSMARIDDDLTEKHTQTFLQKMIEAGALFLILGGAAFLWGVFYYPIACAVAGYTRSFTATINPLIGLETMRIMGRDYLKLLLMCVLLLLGGAFSAGIFNLILSPFDLPQLGNLPAKALGSLLTFYLFVVFSLTIGFALYKNSDKLKLPQS